MAKAFDLVHKVAESPETGTDSNIPFADEEPTEPGNKPPKKRTRVEIVFFYLLLFAIFVIMGVMLVGPNLLNGKKGAKATSTTPSPGSTPMAGYAVDKQGQSDSDVATQLNPSPSPTPPATPSATADTAPPAAATPTQSTQAAKLQILNGTTRTGAAATLRDKLASHGIITSATGNYSKRTVARTTVWYTADYKTAAQQVQKYSGGILAQVSKSTTGNYDVVVIIGKTN